MYWNHRVVSERPGEFEVCEVYYGEDGTPLYNSSAKVYWEEDDPSAPLEYINRMANALNKPVLYLTNSGKLSEIRPEHFSKL